MPLSVATVRAARSVRSTVVTALIALVVTVIVIAVIATKLQSSSSLDLTGDWRAQQGPITVELHLTGSGNHLAGTLATRNSPTAVDGTVAVLVHGNTADVTVNALGQSLKASCDVSNTKLSCAGSSGNQTLALTFTRP